MQLIQVNSSTINNEVKQTVNARELHQFLEVGKVFGAWITERVDQFGFVENQDFVVYSETGKNPSGGRPAKEYALTLDMAKELSMVERNDKGKQARQYFIECERQSKHLPMNPAQMSRLQLLQLAMQAEQERLQLECKVDELKPRAAVADRLTGSDGLLSIRDAAKSLKMKERAFVVWLLENKWLYRDMKGRLRGYSDKTPKYVDHKVTPIPTIDDADKVSLQAMITPAGLTRLADIFNVEAEVYQEAA